jgi:hypothetical protein
MPAGLAAGIRPTARHRRADDRRSDRSAGPFAVVEARLPGQKRGCRRRAAGCSLHRRDWRPRPVQPAQRRVRRTAHRRAAVVPARHRRRLPGRRSARQYGANIFVADLVGLSMLREFAPLITAIIIAGRSGSAYAAQIGTHVGDRGDRRHAHARHRPAGTAGSAEDRRAGHRAALLTVFADVLGVFGGMLMASSQLGVGFGEFLDRFAKAVSVTDFLVGICKAPVFAVIIAVSAAFRASGPAAAPTASAARRRAASCSRFSW